MGNFTIPTQLPDVKTPPEPRAVYPLSPRMRTEVVVGTLAAVLLGQVLLSSMATAPANKEGVQVDLPTPTQGDEHTLHYSFCELAFHLRYQLGHHNTPPAPPRHLLRIPERVSAPKAGAGSYVPRLSKWHRNHRGNLPRPCLGIRPGNPPDHHPVVRHHPGLCRHLHL